MQVLINVTFHFWLFMYFLFLLWTRLCCLPCPHHHTPAARWSDDISYDLAIHSLLRNGQSPQHQGDSIISFSAVKKFSNIILLYEIQQFLSKYFNGKREGGLGLRGRKRHIQQTCCLFFQSLKEGSLVTHVQHTTTRECL